MKSLNLTRLKQAPNLKSYIRYSENFCSLHFCEKLIKESKHRRDNHSVVGGNVKNTNIRDACDISFSFEDPLRNELEQYFTEQMLAYVEAYEFTALNTDQLFPEICIVSYNNQRGYIPHVDANRPFNEKKQTRFISIVAYFNDDYTGGDVYFPNIGVSFKPKQGSCLIFPSDDLFVHGVKPVRGFKLISPCWFHSKVTGINPFGF
jgi:predicted 2-oxoglutarate/Fe(II)-dependent dioxygenase YbiX